MRRKPYNPHQPNPLHDGLVSAWRWYAIATIILFLGGIAVALYLPDDSSPPPIEQHQ